MIWLDRTQLAAVSVASALLSASIRSQSPLYVFRGDQGYSALGAVVRRAGDVNRDGFADILVGIPAPSRGGGRARVYSGKSGRILYEFKELRRNSGLGSAVAACDMNEEGFPDIAVAAPGEKSLAGSVRVLWM